MPNRSKQITYIASVLLISIQLCSFGISAEIQAANRAQDPSLTPDFKSKSMLEELRELKPLPKIHYSWGTPTTFLDSRNNPLMYEFARLTHSLSIGTSPHKNKSILSSRVDNCVYTCARINKTNPGIPCSIAFSYSPWHWKFLPTVKLNDKSYTIFSDPSCQQEIQEFVQQMSFLKEQVAARNQKYGSDVKISAILLDCERFSPRKHDLNWNKKMAKELDDIHTEALKLFPGARVEWYMRGMGGYTAASLSKWYSYFTTLEKNIPSLSYSHYVVSDPEFMQQVFRKTCELADSLAVQEVTPWVDRMTKQDLTQLHLGVESAKHKGVHYATR